jgi:hypothetical protein
LRAQVAPRGPFQLPRWTGADRMLRHRGGTLERLLHLHEEPVVVRVAQASGGEVIFEARAATRDAAASRSRWTMTCGPSCGASCVTR